MPNPALNRPRTSNLLRQACLWLLPLVLVLSLLSPTLSFAATGAPAYTKLTVDNAMETFIRDTVDYPDTFVYNIGQDPNAVTDLLFKNNGYNLMLALSARQFSYSWTGNWTNGYILTITPTYFDATEERVAVRTYVNQVAGDLFLPGMSDLDKLLAVNDFLVRTFDYDQTYSIYSVYPFITQNTGVCQSYAQLAVMLLLAGNMEAYPIAGSSDGVAHAWVGVRVDGIWYEFDPTYDDSIGYQDASTRVAYLARTHEQMLQEGRQYDSYAPYTYKWVKETAPTVVATEPAQVTQPTVQTATSPVTFTDIPAGQWYTDAVRHVSASGLMVGSNGLFRPYGTVTLSQIVAVAARVHARTQGHEDILSEFVNAYSEQRQPWFRAYVDYCKMYGILQGNEFGSSWETRIATREEMAYILHHSIGSITAVRTIAIPDLALVRPAFQSDVVAMAEAGIINGVDAKGTFNPKGSATRAQLAVILARLALD